MLWLAVATILTATIAGTVLVASKDDPNDGAAGTNTTLPNAPAEVTTLPDTTVAATTVPATTLPATTVAVTTVPPTTAAPAPTAQAVPAGWSPASFIDQAFPPVFEGNWIGDPSPQIVDRSAPLPDGLYAASYVRQDASTLELEIRRFETCDVLGEPLCFPGPYGPNDLGTSDVVEGTVAVPLDTSTRVIISGWECGQVVGQGNGVDLSVIYAAISQDYEAAFGAGLAAGTEPSAIIESVRAAPVGGFGIPVCDDDYSLEWRFDGAPTVLVQWPFDWETDGWIDPATLLAPTVIDVNGSTTTVYLYAGFYS